VIAPETNAPIAGVLVGYSGPARPLHGPAGLVARTDAAGQFELSVPPGPTTISIMDASGRGRLSGRDLDVPEDRDPEPVRLVFGTRPQPGGRPAAEVKVRVADAKAGEVRKEAPPPVVRAEVKRAIPAQEGPGRIVMGRVVDPEGRPVVGVRIVYVEPGKQIRTATDREGDFVLGGMPPGDLVIGVDKQGSRPH